MAWQFTSQQPIYQQIIDTIERRIITGAYEMGGKLPSVRELALEAAVNPNTMQRALGELEEKGLIATQRNSGKTVTTDAEAVRTARAGRADGLAEGYLSDMDAIGYKKAEAIGFLKDKEETHGDHPDNECADETL